MQATEITNRNRHRWSQLLSGACNASYIASCEYQLSKERLNRKLYSFIFARNGEDIAGVHYSVKSILGGFVKIADAPAGVLFKSSPTIDDLLIILEHYINWAKGKNISYIRLTPWVPAVLDGKQTEVSLLMERALMYVGFKPIAPGRHSYWIDLTLDEMTLLNKMHRKTRYEIKQGLKSDIKFEVYTEINEGILNSFWYLYNNLAQGKRFSAYDEIGFKTEVKVLVESNLANLYVAKCAGEIVNFSMCSKLGLSFYLHGAINPDFKHFPGCTSPGQIAQWRMLTDLKSQGLETYDMGFCPGPVPIKEHPAYNIWRFKFGFGGIPVQYSPTYGKIIKPIVGSLLHQYVSKM
jgi:hypothetical protein